MLHWLLAADTPIAPIKITCAEIGNCSTKSPNVGSLLVNATHLLLFLVGALAVIFAIVSGLQMAASAGNAKRFAQARESLLYAIVGVGVAILAYAIVSFVAGAA